MVDPTMIGVQRVYGQGGRDVFARGAGDDTLVRGAGVDRMVGKLGNEVCFVLPGDDDAIFDDQGVCTTATDTPCFASGELVGLRSRTGPSAWHASGRQSPRLLTAGATATVTRSRRWCRRGLLVALVALSTAAVASGDEPMLGGVSRAEIVRLLAERDEEFHVANDEALCSSLMRDLRAGTGIREIAPTVATDNYDDPRLAPYKAVCPEHELNVSVPTIKGFGERWSALSQAEQRSRRDDSLIVGFRDFRLYDLDIVGRRGERNEIVFYDDGHSDTVKGKSVDSYGHYRILDTKTCREVGGWKVHRSPNDAPPFHGLVEYENEFYLLEGWFHDAGGWIQLYGDLGNERHFSLRCAVKLKATDKEHQR